MLEQRPRDSDDQHRPQPLPGTRGRVERALADNATVMLRAARRMSLCEDDAHDAVQAAAERFLRYHGTVERENLVGWLITVTRNEALRIRERRVRASGELDDDDRRLVHVGDSLDDLVTRDEELAVAREALARLKPHERQALWLQAEGRSYEEIAQELGWTRTKVNRSLTEGRANLRQGLRRIAAGEGCAIAGPRIDRLAAGTASPEDLRALRPHVRRCPQCRARLRRARGGRWTALPPVLLTWLPWAGRIGGAPPARTRMVEVVADRLIAIVPATSGAVSEAGLALTAGMAAVALGTGMVATGGHGTHHRPHHAEASRPTPARAQNALVRPLTLTPASTTIPGTAATRTTTSTTDDADERRARQRRTDRQRAQRQRRAQQRRAAARRRAAERKAAAPAPSAPAPSPSGTIPTTPGSGARSNSLSGAGTGGSSSSGGSAVDEFSFE